MNIARMVTNKKANLPKQLSAFDLFAGAGGFSFAAHAAGFCVKGAIEYDKNACQTYRANIVNDDNKTTQLFEGDIIDFDPSDILSKTGVVQGELDIMIGGPPCQGFSRHRLKNAGVNDPRNALLLRYFDFVREFRPKVFLIENVPGMLWTRHKSYLERFYKLADAAGYSAVQPVKINAKDFGVPQNRARIFILGFRDKLPDSLQWPPAPTHCNPKEAKAKGLLPWSPASVAFSKCSPKDDANDIHMNHSGDMIQRFRNTPANGGSRFDSGFELPCHKGYKGHRDVYGRIDPSKPGPTITTGCTNPSKGRFVHPTKHHGITIREAARLQSFPDTFHFAGGLGPAGKQIGNAVPIKLGEYILNHLAQYIKQ